MPNPGVCLPVYPTTRKGPPLKKVLSPLLASCISPTMRMNWERGHDPQVCTVVTLQQSSATLDASPSCSPSSAVGLPQTALSPPFSFLSQGFGPWRAPRSPRVCGDAEGPSGKTELVCGRRHVSRSLPSRCLGAARIRTVSVRSWFFLGHVCSGCVGMGPPAGGHPVLGRRGSRELGAPARGQGR